MPVSARRAAGYMSEAERKKLLSDRESVANTPSQYGGYTLGTVPAPTYDWTETSHWDSDYTTLGNIDIAADPADQAFESTFGGIMVGINLSTQAGRFTHSSGQEYEIAREDRYGTGWPVPEGQLIGYTYKGRTPRVTGEWVENDPYKTHRETLQGLEANRMTRIAGYDTELQKPYWPDNLSQDVRKSLQGKKVVRRGGLSGRDDEEASGPVLLGGARQIGRKG